MKKIALSKVLSSILIPVALSFSACGGGGGGAAPADATPADTTGSSTPTGTVLSSDISSDTLLTKDKVWEIDGLVKVRSGATLTIEAGTTLIGEEGANFMVVMKGAKIMAEGTSASPITFTSKTAHEGGAAEDGQWGGLTILGSAPTNQSNPVYEVDESDADFAFGGSNAADNSGVLKHVKILNSGYEVATDVEINGLSLCGVGSGTTIDNITTDKSSDDGIEVWGGTVNMSNLTIIDALDDSLDLDYGYAGTVDGVAVTQTQEAHAGFEISSGGDSPMTMATIKNFTITKFAGSDEGGIYIKDDTSAPTFINGTVTVADGDSGINAKKVMTASQKTAMQFTNVTLNATTKYSGAGAADAQAEHEAVSTTPTSTVLSSDITSNTLLTKDKVWEIDGLVKVRPGATLTIEAGTTIIAEEGANYLVVMKGAKIMADGTSTSAITFTSKIAHEGGTAEDGQWGGLTILGSAPTNQTDPVYEVDESDADFAFGGTDAADNSGVLRHVKILNSGYEVATDVEINGLSLCGVGSGTVIDNVTTVNSSDDGIELWGGTVNMSNLTITNALDDSLDLDYGYAGTVDGVTITQVDAGHAGMEISSGGDNPMTEAIIKNFTITKVAGSDEGGIYIKDDTTAPTFITGTVTVQDGDSGINAKKVMTAAQKTAMQFGDVTLNATTKYDGAGAADAQAEHEANEAI